MALDFKCRFFLLNGILENAAPHAGRFRGSRARMVNVLLTRPRRRIKTSFYLLCVLQVLSSKVGSLQDSMVSKDAENEALRLVSSYTHIHAHRFDDSRILSTYDQAHLIVAHEAFGKLKAVSSQPSMRRGSTIPLAPSPGIVHNRSCPSGHFIGWAGLGGVLRFSNTARHFHFGCVLEQALSLESRAV